MKKVLFLTDFSTHAPEIFKYAADIAYFFKARLILLNAFDQPELKLLSSEENEQLRDIANKRLVSFAESHLPADYKNLKTDCLTEPDFVASAVQKLVAKEAIDLVVMGMTGKDNVMDKIFGSTSQEILSKVNCPVLMIPDSAVFNGIDNVVYTTDFEFRDLAAINYLKKWATAFEAKIHCLHVVEPNENMVNVLRNMEILSETYKSNKNILVDSVEGNFREEIEKFARRKKADIVVMMMRKNNFITKWINSSSVKGVARNINIPLLVIKDDVPKRESEILQWLELFKSIA